VVLAFAGIILIVIPVLVGQISQLVTQIQRSSRASSTGSWNPVDELSAWLHSTFPALDVDKSSVHLRLVQLARLRADRLVAGNTILGIGAGIIAGSRARSSCSS
jgi:hypothetical protein